MKINPRQKTKGEDHHSYLALSHIKEYLGYDLPQTRRPPLFFRRVTFRRTFVNCMRRATKKLLDVPITQAFTFRWLCGRIGDTVLAIRKYCAGQGGSIMVRPGVGNPAAPGCEHVMSWSTAGWFRRLAPPIRSKRTVVRFCAGAQNRRATKRSPRTLSNSIDKHHLRHWCKEPAAWATSSDPTWTARLLSRMKVIVGG